jgi:hypothetical protein
MAVWSSCASRPGCGAEAKDEAVGGVFFFGYFLVDKHKKVTRKSRESDIFQYGAMPYSYCALRELNNLTYVPYIGQMRSLPHTRQL